MSDSAKAEGNTIVCVVAHPDDVGHAMGGTAALLARQHPLHVICLTKGERGIRGTSYEDAARIREAEEREACAILNAGITFMDEINGNLYAGKALAERVAGLLRDLDPRAVFTLWPINTHPDHSACYEIAVQALHMTGRYRTCEVYMVENAIGIQTHQFVPDLYVDISEVIAIKERLVRCHRSQNPTEERVQFILERSRIRGLFADCDYAEGFKTLRPIVNRRNGAPFRSVLLDL